MDRSSLGDGASSAHTMTIEQGTQIASRSFLRPAQAGPTLAHIADRVLGRPLLIHPGKAEVILHVLEGRIALDGALPPLSPDASRFIGTRQRPDGSSSMSAATNGVALVPIIGSLVNRGAWIGANSGLTSYEGLAAQFRELAADDNIHTVVLDMDSSGGEATGMFAAAQAIAQLAKQKQVIAVVNDVAASAAYGMASQAHEIVVSPTSVVGSIGVVLMHMDRSAELEKKGVAVSLIHAGAHKVDGHPLAGPLSDSVRASLQRDVDAFYDQFVGLVGQGRGSRLTADQARDTEARVFIGKEAVRRGLADRVASLDDVLSAFKATAPGASNRSMVSMSEQTNAPRADAGITQDQMNAAVATARAEGAAAERARIGAIMGHAEAEGREKQALTMALETDMSADAAAKVLAASPKAAASAPRSPTIAERAAGMEEFGADASQGKPNKAAAADDAWAKVIAKQNQRVGA